MPFRDSAWEDLQRDYSIFPAYTDYLFGPDTRPHVADEPGLHPMIFPPVPPAPIRYTNSMPSRSWSHNPAQDMSRSASPAALPTFEVHEMPQSLDGDPFSRAAGEPSSLWTEPASNSTCGNRGSQPMRSVPASEMQRRIRLNQTQRRTVDLTAMMSKLPQQSMHQSGHQAQIKRERRPFALASASLSYPTLLHSLSPPDVEEHLARMERKKYGMLSPSASPTPLPAPPLPEDLMQLSHPGLTYGTVATQNGQPYGNVAMQNRYSYEDVASQNGQPYGNVATQKGQPYGDVAMQNRYPYGDVASQNGQPGRHREIPLIRPNELFNNPAYAFLEEYERPRMNHMIAQLWHISQNHPDPHQRAVAVERLQEESQRLHWRREGWEVEMELRSYEAEYVQGRVQADQERFEHTKAPPQAHTASSPYSPYHLAHEPQPAQMSALQTSLGQDPGILTPTSRDNVHAYLPQIWQHVQVAKTRSDQDQDEDKKFAKQQSLQWLGAFDDKLQPDGQLYMRLIIKQMESAKKEGRDPFQVLQE